MRSPDPSPEEFFAAGGPLSRALPGYEPRPQQAEMAVRVAAALREGHALLCEAPTGTGKTLAYLVPAVLSGLRVVISTGTRHLQEQILHKDLPLCEAALGRPVSAALLKGISNYLCLRRLSSQVDAQALLGPRGTLPLFPGEPIAPEAAGPLGRVLSWRRHTTTGDRAELVELGDDDPLWPLVSATSETRLGSRCPFHDECFVTSARRAAAEAQIVIVNHHLLCADLQVRGRFPEARLLPAYDALICDEAHGLEEVATAYFGTSLGAARLHALCRDLQEAQGRRGWDEGPALSAAARRIEQLGARLLGEVRRRALASPAEGRGAFGDGEGGGEAPPPALGAPGASVEEEGLRLGLHGEHVGGEVADLGLQLDSALLEAQELCAARGEGQSADEGRRLSERARALRDDLAYLLEGASRPGGAAVFWLEARGADATLHASPVSAGAILRERLYGDCPSVVFTSATLAPGGRFDYARQRLGLDDRAEELRLDSPFDWARQALLYLPRDLPEPGDPRFVERASRRISALVARSRGRAFLLFTSWRRMHAVWQRLRGELSRRHVVLRQGEAPRRHLLSRFVEAEARGGAVLFATAGFWEGVDVVGPALQLVVMDKLPFSPPDDPLLVARSRRLEEEGLDAFSAYQVPRAAIQVAQGFGRLIRHKGDRGVVALLDRRAAERGYGREVLSAVPRQVPRTEEWTDIERFFASVEGGAEAATK